MTSFSVTKTVSAPDPVTGSVVETYDYPDGAIDALNAMALGGWSRIPQATRDGLIAEAVKAQLAALDANLGVEDGPRTLAPGDGRFAKAADGASLSLDAAGAMWRNSMRFGAFAAQKIVYHGNALSAKGKTDNAWYDSVGSGWQAKDMTKADPTVFE